MTIAPPTKSTKRVLSDDDYPTSDGKPMAETPKHYDAMVYFIEGLKHHYTDSPLVLVAGNNFLFWQEGEPHKRISHYKRGDRTKRVSPDCYVVFGVDKRLRDSYKAWQEDGRLPSVVIEVTSRKTKKEDTDTKLRLYERTLRVAEYILFDPTGDYLKPRLQGYRLVKGRYEPIPLADNRLYSEQLGLEIVVDGEFARLYNPATGVTLRTPQENAQRAEAEARRAEAEAQRAEAEAQRADSAEARLAQALAEIEALRRQAGT